LACWLFCFVGTAIASFLTGITEPIEFAFMFVAPLLYFVHAVLTGVSAFLVTMLGIKHGFGFSAGLIDYLLNMPLATKAWLIIPIGLAFAVVYYLLFRLLIVRLDKTPGRDDGELDAAAEGGARAAKLTEKAREVLAAIGGAENIKELDACITRLRRVLYDDQLADEKALKTLGAAGVLRLGQGSVQIVFGTQSELLKADLILFNCFDVFTPAVMGLEVDDRQLVVEQLKRYTGRPIGLNLEPVDSALAQAARFAQLPPGRAAGEAGESLVSDAAIVSFIEAGADVVLLPSPGTIPGITLEVCRELVRTVHQHGALALAATGTSQEGADEQTIR